MPVRFRTQRPLFLKLVRRFKVTSSPIETCALYENVESHRQRLNLRMYPAAVLIQYSFNARMVEGVIDGCLVGKPHVDAHSAKSRSKAGETGIQTSQVKAAGNCVDPEQWRIL